MHCSLLHSLNFDAPQTCRFELSTLFIVYNTMQDLSRPSASSAASLARMIGGLALAGATANIANPPPSPKPSRMATSQRPESQASAQPGSDSVIAANAQEPSPADGSRAGFGNVNAGGLNDKGRESEAQGHAGASTAGQGSDVGRNDAGQTNTDSDTDRPGSAQGQPQPTAPGQSQAAPAGGASVVSSRDTGTSNSTAASSQAGPSTTPPSSAGNPAVSSNASPGRGAGDAAPAAAVFTDDGNGWTADPVGGGVAQGGPAGPVSIAAYRPGLQAAPSGSSSRVGVGVGVGVGVARGVMGPDEYTATGANPVGSSCWQDAAVLATDQMGDSKADAARRADLTGQPLQVRGTTACTQHVSSSASASCVCVVEPCQALSICGLSWKSHTSSLAASPEKVANDHGQRQII